MQQRPSQLTDRNRDRYRHRPPRRPPARRIRQPRRRNRDRWYLAGTVAIVALSLLAFAALVVAGADRFGDRGDDDTLQAAVDQPAPTATVASVIPTPAASPTGAVTPTTPPATTSDRPIVCLDVGHGGVDEGKLLLSDDGTEVVAMEKDITLTQALELRERLEAQGIGVVLTRETDTEVNASFEDVNGDGVMSEDVDGDGEINPRFGDRVNNLDELQARVNVCNTGGANLLISMHVNGAENLDLRGYEAWYADGTEYTNDGARIANLVVDELGEQFAAAGFETVIRGAAPDSALDLPDEEVDPDDFQNLVMLSPDVPGRNYVGAKMPSIIVECLFLSNEDDAAFLVGRADEAQEAIVTAYEQAILAFFDAGGEENEGEVASQLFGGPGATAEARPTGTPAVEDDDDAATVESGPTPTARPEPLPDNGETAQVHYFGDSGRREIALTFDLGSDRGFAEEILDFLKENEIKATFGVTGRYAEDNPDLIERMVAEGHQLINHTYTHSSFTGASTGAEPLTAEERIEEIESTHDLVVELTGYDMRPYFRLPYGDGSEDAGVARDIYAAGYYLTIMWTCDSFGWKQWSAAEIIQWCYGNANPGGIILMHVGSDGTDQDALPGLVEAFEEDGYAFVTVEEILRP